MIPSASSRQRLAAMGIDVWMDRERRVGEPAPEQDPVRGPAPKASAPRSGGEARLRMASGDGDWLLVQDAPWDGRHDALLGDIQATIGSSRCRFGQWADSESAGTSVAELGSRGIRHVLVFGQAPVENDHETLHRAPALSTLAKSADARRELWRLLSREFDA